MASGSGGSSTASATATAPQTAAIATNDVRQPPSSPTRAPAGTPSTEAAATPLKTREVAAATLRAGTSRTASPAAIAHTPPIPSPTSTRAASSTPTFGAYAASRFAAASAPVRTASTTRRSRLPTSSVTNGADTAATSPVTVSVSPAVPSETRSSRPIGVNSPTGSISDVTTVNVAAASAPTAGQPPPALRPNSPVPSAASAVRAAVPPSMSVMPPANARARRGNNGRTPHPSMSRTHRSTADALEGHPP